MKTLSYMYAQTETIKIGKSYYFGQLWEGTGDGDELLEDGAIAIYDIDISDYRIVDFSIKENNPDILQVIVEVTDIEGLKTRKQIRESIILDIDKAWENQNEARYWLEKLPQEESEYDTFVEDMIKKMVYHINHNDREMFEIDIDDLVEYYHINQENYKFD